MKSDRFVILKRADKKPGRESSLSIFDTQTRKVVSSFPVGSMERAHAMQDQLNNLSNTTTR